MEVKVSIIVPVYKVEKHLKKSVNSILKQTYKNLEIILVDDGSPDNCPKMCDNFAKKDSRIKVIHKENEGVSVARNVGIDIATGEYIVFVDSDDWLPSNSIKDLVTAIKNTDSDFAMGAIKRITVPFNFKMQIGNHKTILSNDYSAMITFLKTISPGPWGKIYKADIIKGENIYFPIGIEYGEDRIFLWKYIKKCKKIYNFTKVVYCYNRLIEESACTKYFSSMHVWYNSGIKEMIEILEQHFDQQTTKIFSTKVLSDSFVFILKYHVFGNGDSQKTIDILKETWDLFKPLFNDPRYIQKDILDANCIFNMCQKNSFKELYDLLIQEKPKDDCLRKAKRTIKNTAIRIKRLLFLGI